MITGQVHRPYACLHETLQRSARTSHVDLHLKIDSQLYGKLVINAIRGPMGMIGHAVIIAGQALSQPFSWHHQRFKHPYRAVWRCCTCMCRGIPTVDSNCFNSVVWKQEGVAEQGKSEVGKQGAGQRGSCDLVVNAQRSVRIIREMSGQ